MDTYSLFAMPRRAGLAALAGLVVAAASSPAAAESPRELGDVDWGRDYDAAQQLSAQTGRPLLVLFDEVPGCQTCVRYGQSVLTHPLIVEAAQTEFVPVAVYNNVGGKDRKVLDHFREPRWNNPVVRIIDAQEKPLAPRIAGRYDQASLVSAMRQALTKAGRPVPGYLSVLDAELSAGRTQTALFAMHCFWSGEACLGAVDGVLATRTGWRDGREVVEVRYAPAALGAVLAAAKRCAHHAYVPQRDAAQARAVFGTAVSIGVQHRPSPKDDRYQLKHSAYARVPMTDLQAIRVNADLGRGRNPDRWLSPGQVGLARAIARKPNHPWPRPTGDLRVDMRRSRSAG